LVLFLLFLSLKRFPPPREDEREGFRRVEYVNLFIESDD